MSLNRNLATSAPNKAPTGIMGFDEITGGGLPRGRTRMRELRGADAAAPRRKAGTP